jgi:hypothetical protein
MGGARALPRKDSCRCFSVTNMIALATRQGYSFHSFLYHCNWGKVTSTSKSDTRSNSKNDNN